MQKTSAMTMYCSHRQRTIDAATKTFVHSRGKALEHALNLWSLQGYLLAVIILTVNNARSSSFYNKTVQKCLGKVTSITAWTLVIPTFNCISPLLQRWPTTLKPGGPTPSNSQLIWAQQFLQRTCVHRCFGSRCGPLRWRSIVTSINRTCDFCGHENMGALLFQRWRTTFALYYPNIGAKQLWALGNYKHAFPLKFHCQLSKKSIS